MSEEIANDNISLHSIDFISHRQNRYPEMILEEKASLNNEQNNIENNENKTQYNFNKVPNPLVELEQKKRYNSCERRKKNKILQKKIKEILDYREKFKNMETEENLEEERINKEESEKKKKVESKVNRNLKLLNLIKEKMNQNKDIKKDNINEDKENNDNKENNKENKEDNKKENIVENNNNNENNDINKGENFDRKNEEKKRIDEEKKKKLLKIFDNRKISEEIDNNNNKDNSDIYKTDKNENKENQKIKENEENKENDLNKEKESENKLNKEKEKDIKYNYQKRKVPHSNTGSVSYPTFMKKGAGNFHINTPKSINRNNKNKSKIDSNEKEENKTSNIIYRSNKKNNKYSEIPIEQKNKLTINIKPKNISFINDNSNKKSNQNSDIKKKEDSENNKISLSNKKEEKINLNNNINNNSKKGAMKILELLKAKKKEENENNKFGKNEEEEDTEQNVDNNNQNEISSTLLNNKKNEIKKIIKNEKRNGDGINDIMALPKKKFREEDEDNNYMVNEKYNKTQQIFRKSNKKINQNDDVFSENKLNMDNDNNNSNRIKTNYFNNINNNINNFFNISESRNFPERKTIEYINNANFLRNKYHRKRKAFNSTNQVISEENYIDNEDDIFRMGNNSQINYMNQKNTKINKKNLDKSYDMLSSRQNPIKRSVINRNLISNINGPKKLSNINKINPTKLIPYLSNERNSLNNMKRNGRIYNKINYKRYTPAYIKKSPGKINIMNKEDNYKKINPISNRNNIRFNQTQVQKIYNKSNINNINSKINNNDVMEISTIYGINSSIDSSVSNKTNNKIDKLTENQKENTMLFNLEDLLVLEEKLNNITFSLESNKNLDSQCFNFWSYYFNCSFYKIFEKLFPNEEDSNIIRLSINYLLMSIMVCYDFAFSDNIDDEDLNLSLIELIYFNHTNLMIISEFILTKISPENTNNKWVLKLQEIVKNSKFSQSKEIKTNFQSSSIQRILNNTNKIMKKIKSILLNYQSESSSLLKNYILNLPKKTYSEINKFFRSQILRIDDYEGSLVPPSFFRKNKDFIPLPAPYLQYPSNKPYTLILDLDETLISFQIKSKKEGTLRARPFLFAFLEEMGHYYELIVWTSATEAYANSLIDAIEYDKQYFDYILFREHAIIIGDEFVKDLNRVGRGLDRIIIVDDMPQNFRLQKQNGITIKPFYGDDYNDTALYDLLPILKHIAEDGNDVRIELAKYRDEIVKKITSNISLYDI